MSWDPVWEDVFVSQAWGKYPGEELIRFVARNFYSAPERRAVRLLEVGCGPGANLWFMAREGFSAFGIDGSKTAVDRALLRLDAECAGWRASGAEVRVGDITELPWPDGFFDGALDNEAVCCNAFDAAQRIYAEMARVLRPGARLFVRTFATGTVGDGTGRSLGHHAWEVAEGPLLGKGYSRFSSREDLDQLLRGLRIDSVDLLTWTVANQTQMIREWIVLATKV